MRNNTTLMAILIAVAAGGFGYGLSAYLQNNTAPVVAETTTSETVDADVANVETSVDTATETASATDTTTQDTQADAQLGMTEVDLDQVALNESVPAAGDAATAMTTPAAETTETSSSTEINVKEALEDRYLGSESAPLTIYDYSSLTCPHCAAFHKTILPGVKEKLIDKGQVRWVFVGFPLNEASMKAEMVARCAPKDQYVKLIDLMFQTQSRWAFEADPLATLSLVVKSAGISEEMFLACVNNKELEAGMYEKARQAVEKHKINSTPTFIFNDGAKKVTGVGSVEGFIYDAERFIRESSQSTPASALTEEAPAQE